MQIKPAGRGISKPIFWAIACLVMHTAAVEAAPPAKLTGYEPGFWKNRSVVYALVENVTKAQSGEIVLSLQPIASLAGEIDPSRSRAIEARAWIGFTNSAIRVRPDTNSYAVLLLVRQGGAYYVDSNWISFLPEGTAIVPVNGDPTPVMRQLLGILHTYKSARTQ